MRRHHDGVLAVVVKLLRAILYKDTVVSELVGIDKRMLEVLPEEDGLMEDQQVFISVLFIHPYRSSRPDPVCLRAVSRCKGMYIDPGSGRSQGDTF